MLNKEPAYEIRKASSLEEMYTHFDLIQQLYKNLPEETYQNRIQRMVKTGYTQAGCYNDEGICIGVIGYTLEETLFEGPTLHVNDLVVDHHSRSGGLGSILLDWIKQEAKLSECESITVESLDREVSSETMTRLTRFYERNGFEKEGSAFGMSLRAPEDRYKPLSPGTSRRWEDRVGTPSIASTSGYVVSLMIQQSKASSSSIDFIP